MASAQDQRWTAKAFGAGALRNVVPAIGQDLEGKSDGPKTSYHLLLAFYQEISLQFMSGVHLHVS